MNKKFKYVELPPDLEVVGMEKKTKQAKRKPSSLPETPVPIAMGYFEGEAISSIIAPVLSDDLKRYYMQKRWLPGEEEDWEHLDRFFERTEHGRPFISGSAIIGMMNMYCRVVDDEVRDIWGKLKQKIHVLRMEGEPSVLHKRFVGGTIVVYECFPARARLYLHYLDMGLSDEERETLKRIISKVGSTIGVGAWIRRGFGRFKLL